MSNQSRKNRRNFQVKKLEWEVKEGNEFLKTESEERSNTNIRCYKDWSHSISNRLQSYQSAHDALAAVADPEEVENLEEMGWELLDSASILLRKLDSAVEEMAETLREKAELEEKRRLEEKTEQLRREERQLQVEKEKLDRDLQLELESMRLKAMSEDHMSKKEADSDESAVAKQKLPELRIPNFDGNRLKWLEFWEMFEATVGKMKISPREKLGRLKTYLVRDTEAERCIAGLALTGRNYEIAVNRLQERFGNKDDIIKDHMEKLQGLAPTGTSIRELRCFWDTFEIHVEQMEALGEDLDSNILALNLIQSKLPNGVMIRLNEMNNNSRLTFADIRRLMREYLKSRDFAIREVSKPIFDKMDPKLHQTTNFAEKPLYRTGPAKPTISTLVAANNPEQRIKKCFYCSEEHWSDECSNFPDFESRKRKLGSRCFKCFQEGHSCQKCPRSDKPCFNCKKKVRHHRSLCQELFNQGTSTRIKMLDSNNTVESEIMQSSAVSEGSKVAAKGILYPTAWVTVRNPDGKKSTNVRLLLDSGSNKNYITESLARTLNLEMTFLGVTPVFTFGSRSAKNISSSGAELELQLVDKSWMKFPVKVVEKVTGTVYEAPSCTDSLLQSYRTCILADLVPETEKEKPIDLLIGMDSYHEVLQRHKYWQAHAICPGLNLENSAIGWILSGRVPLHMSFKSKNVGSLLSSSHESDCIMMCSERNQFFEEQKLNQVNGPDTLIAVGRSPKGDAKNFSRIYPLCKRTAWLNRLNTRFKNFVPGSVAVLQANANY